MSDTCAMQWIATVICFATSVGIAVQRTMDISLVLATASQQVGAQSIATSALLTLFGL